MLEVIEKLLILQERDLQILKIKEELSHLPPERQQLQTKTKASQSRVETLKEQFKHLESERKRLELEAEGKKQQIEKYSLQQFQTKKNEEYRALANEIDSCKRAIRKLEDQQLDLMEQADSVQKQSALATKQAAQTTQDTDSRLVALSQRQEELQTRLAELETTRESLASAVEDPVRLRYERLLKHRGRNVLVGIQHGVCGGCHMRLSRQTLVSCQAEQDIITCANCGRILFYTPDMDLAATE